MFRRLLLILGAATALIAQAPAPKKASALDKATLEVWLRHLFVWPAPIQVTINDPKPGPMSDFYSVQIRGTSGPQMQEETFYVSKDGQKIIRGSVYDINQNPFKPELDKLKTEMRPSFGTPGAPVVIAEFSDFECPFCREEAKTLRDNILKTYPKEVRVYFFDFPLEQLHPWAKSAAIAGRCVFRQSASAFWDYHDWMFDHQADVTADNLKSKVVDFAKMKHLDDAQLNSCMDTKATEGDVNQTLELGHSLGVNQTPTIFVNGRRLAGSMSWNDLKLVIDYEIGYQKIAKNAGEDCGCDVRLPMPGVQSPATSTLHK
ncbi:MAG TPA: thioredoxin domain-containing protein [Bryobacteraceae bacterium]|nr:thioredoxin domain-containing protein [Bryobacteraceae bacterium]